MKICTINIPDQYLDCLEIMQNLGFYPSRSEAIRDALKQFLKNEGQLYPELDPKVFGKMKKKQMETMTH